MTALFVTGAFAQSNVTLSGQVDIGVVNPVGTQKLRIDQSGNGANQIVFSGSEDLEDMASATEAALSFVEGRSVDELALVKAIGAKTLENNRSRLTVGAVGPAARSVSGKPGPRTPSSAASAGPGTAKDGTGGR